MLGFFVLLVLETGLVFWAWEVGSRELGEGLACSVDCGRDGLFYYYDSGYCACVDGGYEFVREVEVDVG